MRPLKVSKTKAEETRRSGEIDVTMVGRLVRFTPSAVRDFLAANTIPLRPGTDDNAYQADFVFTGILPLIWARAVNGAARPGVTFSNGFPSIRQLATGTGAGPSSAGVGRCTCRMSRHTWP
jgi:hypothetical protein